MSSKNNFYFTLQGFHKEVTGSCILCTIHFPNNTERHILVDSGLFQETKYEDLNRTLDFNINNIDAIVLTHPHIDHIGKLPYLVKEGYNGPIYCTTLTRKVSNELLQNSAKTYETEYQKELKVTRHPEPPLYTSDDVETTISLMKVYDYNDEIEIFDNVFITFCDNGHLISASCVFLQAHYNKHSPISILFTGDYAKNNIFKETKAIPEYVKEGNINIVSESTIMASYVEEEPVFRETVISCYNKGKALLILSLAQERLETILYNLKKIQDDGYDLEICVDTPLGSRIEKIYRKSSKVDYMPKDILWISSKEEREIIFKNPKKRIYIASSGMADFGNAPFYLENFLPRTDVEILFTSYLSEHSLGRKIVEAPSHSKICIFPHQKGVLKRAIVTQTREFSSHSNPDELLEFLLSFDNLKNVFINHGTFEAQEMLKETLDNLCVDTTLLGTNMLHTVTNKGDLHSMQIKESEHKIHKDDNRPSKHACKTNKTVPVFIRNNAFSSSLKY